MVNSTKFGKKIEKRLVDLEKTSSWLSEQVRERTGLYCDTSYLHKIKTGKCATPSIVKAICEILDISA